MKNIKSLINIVNIIVKVSVYLEIIVNIHTILTKMAQMQLKNLKR